MKSDNGFFFVFLVTWFTGFYAVIFETTKSLNITLTPDWVSNPYTVCVTALSGAVVTGVLALHCLFAAQDQNLTEFLAFLGLALALHIGLLIAPGKAHVHIHHWYWAWALAHICVFDSRTSEVAQAMFCGGFIHGAALFGVEKCFYASAEEDNDEEKGSSA